MKDIFYRLNQYLFFSVLVVVVFYFGKPLLVPIALAALLAMLMAPVCRKLDNIGFHRGLSSAICVLIIFLSIATIVAIVGGQVASFAEDLPKIERKANELLVETQTFIERKLGVSPEKQKEIVEEEAKSSAQSGGGTIITTIVAAVIGTVGGVALTLVFTFLMIFNKEHFEDFFLRLYKDHDQGKVKKIVAEIARVSQHYLTGRAMSILINATMYAIGLSIVGIKNAVLLACVAAVLTLLPYIGTVIGGLFPVLMALVTDSIETAFYAAGVLLLVQTIDNYFIEPNVVGGEVNLSALTTILTLLTGGLIWGPAGMILFVPLTAIVKIVCDQVEPLQPIGFVLSEGGGKKPSRIKTWITEKFKRKKTT